MYMCDHGTVHSTAEFNAAIRWAAMKFVDKTLVQIGERCWIEVWRQECEER